MTHKKGDIVYKMDYLGWKTTGVIMLERVVTLVSKKGLKVNNQFQNKFEHWYSTPRKAYNSYLRSLKRDVDRFQKILDTEKARKLSTIEINKD